MSEDTATIREVNINVASINVTEEAKKPRLAALLFAEYAITSEEKKITLCGIFDRILIDREKEEKKRLHRFFVYIKMAETVSGSVHLAILNPEGKPIAGGAVETVEHPAGEQPPRYMQILQQIIIELPVNGVYWFDVFYREQLLGRVPLIVGYNSEKSNVNIPD